MISYPKTSDSRGFTLVEVLVGLFVFSIMAGGLISATLMTKRVALKNVNENMAFMAAQGYVEQIKAMPYLTVLNALEQPGAILLPTDRVMPSSSAGATISQTDTLAFSATAGSSIPAGNMKSFVVEIEPDGTTRLMTMRFELVGIVNQASTEGWEGLEITLNYSWDFFDGRSTQTQTSSILFVKARVS